MKKSFLIFFVSLAFLFLFSGMASAVNPYPQGCTGAPMLEGRGTTDPDANGIVPCGVSYICKNSANEIVACSTCTQNGGAAICSKNIACPCQFGHFFTMLSRIYIFITWTIAIPLAGLLIVIGGVIMLVSGGNPNWFEFGKRMLWGAFWGVLLIFGAWIIVSIIFLALGINLNPGIFQFN